MKIPATKDLHARRRALAATATGVTAALIVGAPALADDTELLLLNPDPAVAQKPNILFVLDTSSSMGTIVSSAEPYDDSVNYSGNCDSGVLYWSDVDMLPDCSVPNAQYIDKAAFQCKAGEKPIRHLGSYTNTMVQYRTGDKDGDGSDPARWQSLAPGYHDALIECQADSGQHGDGRKEHKWAAGGTNLDDPFTKDAGEELAWGSAPRNISYTVFDGNYLNWRSQTGSASLSLSAIMQSVTTAVLDSEPDINVGIMQFNNRDGGAVIVGIKDLNANKNDIKDAVAALPADGFSPLSETLYESALYWRGDEAHYTDPAFTNVAPTDPAALASVSPDVYAQPPMGSCGKNYTVLLTDGEPTEDDDTPTLATTLPLFAETLDRTSCTGTGPGHCLDDIAEYLSKVDLDPTATGQQGVVTHTIGYTVDLPILEETARNSGGRYFLADDISSLTRTLNEIIGNITDRGVSFSKPIVPVNSFNRTQNLANVYFTMFGARNKIHWPGNLKRYILVNQTLVDIKGMPAVDLATGFFADTARSVWSATNDGSDVELGGAANLLPDPASRRLYTNIAGNSLKAAANAVSPGNVDTFSPADLGLTGAPGEPTREELIRWARGEDLKDEDDNPATTIRYAMGDPLHSQPAAVVYGGSSFYPDTVVYVATNDGYLHAIDGNSGNELWSFIPQEFLSNLSRLYFDPAARYKHYGIDGDIVPIVRDNNQDGILDSSAGDYAYIVFGFRRGGSKFYALDVTDKTSPTVLWTAAYPEFGESWSAPSVATVLVNEGSKIVAKEVLVIGGGYDTVHDTSAFNAAPDQIGAGIHVLDLKSGARIWRAGTDSGADLVLQKMTRAIPTSVRVIDLNGDSFADRMYAADLGGQIWRFDIANGNAAPNLIAGGVIAQLGAEGTDTPSPAETRRFYNTPDISLITDKFVQNRFIAISIGSGYRAHPFDLSATDRFYSVRDPNVFSPLTQTQYDNYDIINDSDLIEVSGETQTVVTSNLRGWKFTLPPDEKVLTDSVTFNDELFFVAFSPNASAASNCASGYGSNTLYRMSVINGDPTVPNTQAMTAEEADDARRDQLQQGGIAPSPEFVFPPPTAGCFADDCQPRPIVCVGVECFDPGFVNNPVRTLWTQDGIE